MPAFEKVWPGFALVKFKCWEIDGRYDSEFQYIVQDVTKEMTKDVNAIPTMVAKEGYGEPFEFWKVEYLGAEITVVPPPHQIARWLKLFLPSIGIEAQGTSFGRRAQEREMRLTFTTPPQPEPRPEFLRTIDEVIDRLSRGYEVLVHQSNDSSEIHPSSVTQLRRNEPATLCQPGRPFGIKGGMSIERLIEHLQAGSVSCIPQPRETYRRRRDGWEWLSYDEIYNHPSDDFADATYLAMRSLGRHPEMIPPPVVFPTSFDADFIEGGTNPLLGTATDAENLDHRTTDAGNDDRSGSDENAGSLPAPGVEGSEGSPGHGG